MDDSATKRAIEVLRLAKAHHNVLIYGPPATGKSRVLNEAARLFRASLGPGHNPSGKNPLPEKHAVGGPDASDWLPSHDRPKREVFMTAFHQGSKYREFLRGVSPAIGKDAQGFVVSEGILYRAALVAGEDDGAALLLIDEINRGPAVQVFGDSIVALERDKRLGSDGSPLPTTQYFEIPDDDGVMVEFALPHHLYIVAAMNQADTSVEPLDVAFQRRFEPYYLEPDTGVLCAHFGITGGLGEVVAEPASAVDVYSAATRAWEKVNARIALGRGREYQIGHGIFMDLEQAPPTDSVDSAVEYVRAPWQRIRTHVEEVFFGNVRGVAAVLNVGAPGHPLILEESFFAGDPVATITASDSDLYALLRAVAAEDAA